LKRGCASEAKQREFFSSNDLFVIYKDTMTDYSAHLSPLKYSIKHYEVELQHGLKKKKEFFIMPGNFKDEDSFGFSETSETFKVVSGRET
jgi:hypothetical protein